MADHRGALKLEPNSSDLAKWRKLIREAERAARNSLRATGDLFSAATKANSAVAPGREERANPFFVLREIALSFCADRRRRFELQDDLKRAAETCAAILDPPRPPAPAAAMAAGGSRLPYRDE